MTLWLFAANKM